MSLPSYSFSACSYLLLIFFMNPTCFALDILSPFFLLPLSPALNLAIFLLALAGVIWSD